MREFQIPSRIGTLAAIEWGPANGMPILALHGWQENALTFQPLVELLPDNLRIVAIEFCGHGYSSHLAKGYPYDTLQYILCVLEAVNWLNWEKCTIMGHSLGAIIAIKFAAIFPKRVENIISLDIMYPHVINTRIAGIPLTKGIEIFLMKNSIEFSEPISFEKAVELSAKSRQNVSRKNIELLLQRGLRPSKQKEGLYEFTWDQRLILADWFTFECIRTDKCMEEFKNFYGSWLAILNIGNEIIPGLVVRSPSKVTEAHIVNCKLFKVVELDTKTHHPHLEFPELVAPHIKKFLFKLDSHL